MVSDNLCVDVDFPIPKSYCHLENGGILLPTFFLIVVYKTSSHLRMSYSFMRISMKHICEGCL
jgi:hypothetical protein